MVQIRVSLSYRRIKYSNIETFASAVVSNMTDNPTVFPTMPITQTIMQAFIATYVLRYGIYKQGGLGQKTSFINAWKDLIAALDQLAEYVDSVANGDEGIIVQAGFVPTKGIKTKKTKPEPCTGLMAKNMSTGVMSAECDNDPAAEYYICICTEGAPLPPNTVINNAGQLVIHHSSGAGNSGSPVPGTAVPTMRVSFIDLTTKRKKVFRGLTVGSVYYFVFSAVNAGGASDLSDPVMKTCW